MKKISSPFRQLELQLQLQDLDEKWEIAKKTYNKKNADAQAVDEIIKLTAERIKVLAEIYMNVFEV